MEHNIKTVWKEGMAFDSQLMGGNIALDADEAVGGQGKGVTPKQLMLSALSGCTAMDVASLMKKMRVAVDGFEVSVAGKLTEEHPKYYKTVKVVYNFEGKDLDQAKLNKIVNMSIERYCGVFEMFRQFADITTEINFVEVNK